MTGAVLECLAERGEDVGNLSVCKASGGAECKKALLLLKAGRLPEDFIEGMACEGGCIGGPACLSHSQKNKLQFAKYEKMDKERTITDAIGQFDMPDN